MPRRKMGPPAMAPLLAILGALAAFVAKVKIEIVREGDVPPGKSPTQ